MENKLEEALAWVEAQGSPDLETTWHKLIASEVRRLRAERDALKERLAESSVMETRALQERDTVRLRAEAAEQKVKELERDRADDNTMWNQDRNENRRLRKALNGMIATFRDDMANEGSPLDLARKALRESSGGGEARP